MSITTSNTKEFTYDELMKEYANAIQIIEILHDIVNKLKRQIAELKPYRDGYSPHDKCPDEGENVIATKNGSMFIAQLRDNVWHDALGNCSEVRGGVERWWYLPDIFNLVEKNSKDEE